jgi:hypothetical protein
MNMGFAVGALSVTILHRLTLILLVALQRPLRRDDASLLAWVPSAGIDYDVIREDLPLYLGAGSFVERANHPKVS